MRFAAYQPCETRLVILDGPLGGERERPFDDGSQLEFLNYLRIAGELRRAERMVIFDLDERDDAIVELDRMHAEIRQVQVDTT